MNSHFQKQTDHRQQAQIQSFYEPSLRLLSEVYERKKSNLRSKGYDENNAAVTKVELSQKKGWWSMKKLTKNKQDISVSPTPIETIIPLLEPVKIYTAKELAAMPLSKMNEAIEAQEKYYLLEHTTRMGGAAIAVRTSLQDGGRLVQVKEKSRIRYKLNNEFIEPRIVRQLEMRGLVNLGGAK